MHKNNTYLMQTMKLLVLIKTISTINIIVFQISNYILPLIVKLALRLLLNPIFT